MTENKTPINRFEHTMFRSERFRTADPKDEYVGDLIQSYLLAHGYHTRPTLELPSDAYGDPMELVKPEGSDDMSNPQEHANSLFLRFSAEDFENITKLLKELGLDEPKQVDGKWLIPDHWSEQPRHVPVLQIDITRSEKLDKAMDTILRDEEFWAHLEKYKPLRIAPEFRNHIDICPLHHPMHKDQAYFRHSAHPEFTMAAAADDSETNAQFNNWFDSQRVAAVGTNIISQPKTAERLWKYADDYKLTDRVTDWIKTNEPKVTATRHSPKAIAHRILEGRKAQTIAVSHGAIFAHEVNREIAAFKAKETEPKGPLDHAVRDEGSEHGR